MTEYLFITTILSTSIDLITRHNKMTHLHLYTHLNTQLFKEHCLITLLSILLFLHPSLITYTEYSSLSSLLDDTPYS